MKVGDGVGLGVGDPPGFTLHVTDYAPASTYSVHVFLLRGVLQMFWVAFKGYRLAFTNVLKHSAS